ncbi:MAG: CvpA family protein [Oscillospiraceae bacterium]|nr:CvpA family protein [Oscillospiraceae bacterium]
MNIVPVIYDVAIIIIALMFISKSMRKGFIASLITTLGYFASLALAIFGGKFLSKLIFAMFFEAPIANSIDSKISQTFNASSISGMLDGAVESVPKLFRGIIENQKITSAQMADQIGQQVISGELSVGHAITQNYIQPIVCIILQIILSAILFSVLMFAVKIISRMARGVKRIPLLGPINKLLGGALGFVQASIIIYLVALLAGMILTAKPDGYEYLNYQIIDSTYLFKIFFSFDASVFLTGYGDILNLNL